MLLDRNLLNNTEKVNSELNDADDANIGSYYDCVDHQVQLNN